MEDSKIIDLYWERAETAITETAKKYGRYCHFISYQILYNNQDAEECVNDTYFRAWKAMPPQRPNRLSIFLGKITRNLAIDKYRQYTAEKRGIGQTELVLSELDDCIPAQQNTEQQSEEILLVGAIDAFLADLSAKNRIIFVRRYWYLISIKEIAEQYGMSESKVKSTLFRLRNRLRIYLEKEGIVL